SACSASLLSWTTDWRRPRLAATTMNDTTSTTTAAANSSSAAGLSIEDEYKHFIQLASEGLWRFDLQAEVATDHAVHEQAEAILRHACVALCNDTFARQFGYESPAAMKGTPFADLLSSTREEQLGFIVAFIMSGYRLDNLLLAERRRDGSIFRSLNNLSGDVENGRLLRIWGVKRDV